MLGNLDSMLAAQEIAIAKELIHGAGAQIREVARHGSIQEFRNAIDVLLGREVYLDRISTKRIRRLVLGEEV
jgi:hypothetical protein